MANREDLDDFMNNRDLKECPVEIKGHELLEAQYQGNITSYLILAWTAFCFIAHIFGEAGDEIGETLFLWVIVLVLIAWISGFIYKLSGSGQKAQYEADVIYEFFKRKFNIHNEFNENNHIRIESLKRTSSIGEDNAMFSLFMSAYQLGGDALVIHSNNTTYEDKKQLKSSTEISATIIKYK